MLGEAPKIVRSAGLVAVCSLHAASHMDRGQKYLGKSPFVTVVSQDASQMGNTG